MRYNFYAYHITLLTAPGDARSTSFPSGDFGRVPWTPWCTGGPGAQGGGGMNVTGCSLPHRWVRVARVHFSFYLYHREPIFGFIVIPSHKIIMLLLYLIEKTVVNPVRCMNVWLGSVKPSWGRLCAQVDHLNPSPLSHDWCIVRTIPPF